MTFWSVLSDLCRLGNYLPAVGHDQAAFPIDDQRQPVFSEFFNNGPGRQTELIWIYKFALFQGKYSVARSLTLFAIPSRGVNALLGAPGLTRIFKQAL